MGVELVIMVGAADSAGTWEAAGFTSFCACVAAVGFSRVILTERSSVSFVVFCSVIVFGVPAAGTPEIALSAFATGLAWAAGWTGATCGITVAVETVGITGTTPAAPRIF